MTIDVLVPVDASEQSDAALEFALEEYSDISVTALHVIDLSEMYAGMGDMEGPVASEQLVEKQRETAEEVLESAAAQGDDRGIAVETEMVTGDPAQSIVEYADDHDIDHIVIGSHGRTGASRLLLGSVSETVVRRAPVPVTVVR